MKTEYKHLVFSLLTADDGLFMLDEKQTYLCNNKSGEILGVVSWYAPWNQYCYYDQCEGVYSQSCLKDIADFINQLKDEGQSK